MLRAGSSPAASTLEVLQALAPCAWLEAECPLWTESSILSTSALRKLQLVLHPGCKLGVLLGTWPVRFLPCASLFPSMEGEFSGGILKLVKRLVC